VNSLLESLHGFRFADPWLLLALALIPLWAWLRGRYAPVAAVQFSSSKLLREASRPARFSHNRFLLLLRFVALALLIAALARPQVEKGLTDREAMGINMMLALDFSGSMKTKDFLLDGRRASRADSMKKVFAEFIRARENDKVGVVRFDASAALISPLTLDHDWLLAQLAREETTHGTNVGDGMVIAANALLPAKKETKVIILATDADNINEGPQPADVSRAIAPLGIKMHVIQIVDFKDMGGYVACGPLLQEAAKITGGQFFQVADANGLRNVYRQIDQLEKAKFKENKQKTYRELMVWLALPGLLLLLTELTLAHTVWRRLP
jgi:Ca-activated chloride channel homolog